MAIQHTIETKQKALEINLDTAIYGAFAEIGAGQEVARHFFRAGAAAGTIAKTMSAYDKKYSDDIYGAESHGRYVCESRLYKMLQHEYDLMEERLREERPNTTFFAFADTISAINFKKTNKGHGWMGLRFQLDSTQPPNDIVLHVKMMDNDNGLQQQAVGVLGVNLIYACFRYYDDIDMLVKSLLDGLRDRVEVDMMRISGPYFRDIDNRLLCLKMIKMGLSPVTMFNHAGEPIHPSEVLYKQSLLIVRGSYRPTTLVNMDMIKSATEQFKQEIEVDAKRVTTLAEITLDNLMLEGEIDEQDFLDRVTLLCAQRQMVLVTNCEKHEKLIHYFADYRIPKLGLVVGAQILLNLINETYYQNVHGSLLLAFGSLFNHNVKMYIYPIRKGNDDALMNCSNLPIPEGTKFLYRYLLEAKHIEDVHDAHAELLHIYSTEVLRMIRADEHGWERLVPATVAKLIKDQCLFNYPCQNIQIAY
jgi:hypothetical protein